MILFQSFKMALTSIRSNKMRSFLTMLGIIIGVFSLVVLVSLVTGVSGKITDVLNSLGNNIISVSINEEHAPFTIDNMEELKDLEHVDLISAFSISYGRAVGYTNKNEPTIVIGTDPSYELIQHLKIGNGRYFMTPDMDNHTNVVVINYDLAVDLMGRTDVVGETIRINGTAFRIVGVLEKSGTLESLLMMKYMAYVPRTTLARMDGNVSISRVDEFVVSAKDGDAEAAETELNQKLQEIYRGDDSAFDVYNEGEMASAMTKISAALSLLLGGIAAVSLLVGGIGIMNIMLVSVTERTKEIGIRKAIGARPGVILFQFLVEAMILSIIGCLIGLLLSWVALRVISIIANSSFGVSITVAVVAVIFSMGVGVLFGIYPANKAAKMRPIDALRFN